MVIKASILWNSWFRWCLLRSWYIVPEFSISCFFEFSDSMEFFVLFFGIAVRGPWNCCSVFWCSKLVARSTGPQIFFPLFPLLNNSLSPLLPESSSSPFLFLTFFLTFSKIRAYYECIQLEEYPESLDEQRCLGW